jgi:hypothetical protein
MTEKEIVEALEKLIQEDAKRPAEEQLRGLIEAGVIDERGRVLIGSRNGARRDRAAAGKEKPKVKGKKRS